MKKLLLLISVMIAYYFLFSPKIVLANTQLLPSGIPDTDLPSVIDSYIEDHKDTTAAVSIKVFRNEDTIYDTDYGLIDIENQVAVDENTVYEWGSISKLLVWVSLMQLWEQDKVDLEEDITSYLPENFLTKLRYDQPITLLNLMNHNAGWEDTVFQMSAIDAESVLPLEDALKTTEPQQFYEPGATVAYSNWGVSLAGYIVERISGQHFYDYVQDNIFEPLGMANTSLSPLYVDNPEVGAQMLENKGYNLDLTPDNQDLMYLNLYPAGSVSGTIDDLATFSRALIPNSPGSALLFDRSDTHLEMFSPTLTYPASDIDYINHGFWSHEFNVQTLGHGGNTLSYASHLMVDPLSGVGFVVMTNQVSDTIYNYGLPPIIFGEVGSLAAEEDTYDDSNVDGRYYSTRTIREGIGKMYSLQGLETVSTDDNGDLIASIFGLINNTARNIAPDTFVYSYNIGDIHMDMLNRFSNEDGTKKLSAIYGDSVEADSSIQLMYYAIILYAGAVIWSLLVLLIAFISFVTRKVRGIESPNQPLNRYQVIVALTNLVPLFIIVRIAQMMMTTRATVAEIIPYTILSSTLALVPLVYAFILVKKWPQHPTGKLQKISYIITALMGFVVTFLVNSFEMYKI